MLKRKIAAVAATVALAGAIAAPAAASEVAVTGGSLAFTSAPVAGDFSALTLDGTTKTTTAAVPAFEVNDSRGTGAGWNITVQGTQLKEWDGALNAGAGGYVTGGKTIATSSLALSQPTVAADGTTSAAPSITAGPYTIDAGSAVKIASAAVDTGMGKYDFGATTMTLTVPPNTYAKTYRSDVTVTLATTP
ncbi:MAG TPA: WxL domain-containing protein [Egibacteraceae bacterium]|nr:WxL domain-containing protein [Egibacteraceae bacterium]